MKEKGEWLGISLKGRSPAMGYVPDVMVKLKSAIESRFASNKTPLIRATILLNLEKWPDHAHKSLREEFSRDHVAAVGHKYNNALSGAGVDTIEAVQDFQVSTKCLC